MVEVLQRCPISACRDRVPIGFEMEQHLFEHYNYCEHGHYEEFNLFDSRWPNCMNENMED